MEISCAFATSMNTPALIADAERLGYRRAWCYDSPGLYPDVWVVLALAAAQTSTIGLGPAVLVPSLRHPMVNAAAIATLLELAPGRVAVVVGAGFTGRMVLGQRPMKWSDVRSYVKTLKALLGGGEAEWEGHVLKMLHPPGHGAPRPLTVPLLVAADGPKGLQIALELGDGVFSAVLPQPGAEALPWRGLLQFGTVLDDGEELSSPRVAAAAGPGVAAAYHALYERGGRSAMESLPGGPAWSAAIESVPAHLRHLAIHGGHLVHQSDYDRIAWDESSAMVKTVTLSGTRVELRQRLLELEALGTTEIAYQPAGPDPARELEAFAEVANLRPRL